MSDVSSGMLSDFCFTAMWNYYNDHDNEVGSEFRGDRRNRAQTNCIIYVYNVLNYGYAKLARNDVVANLKAMFLRQDGMELSKYLVGQGWKAHYWNPDVYKPRDAHSEHIVSFKQALATRQYYGVSLSGLIVGYNKQEKFRTEHRGWIWPFGEDIYKGVDRRPGKSRRLRGFEKSKIIGWHQQRRRPLLFDVIWRSLGSALGSGRANGSLWQN